MYGLIRKNKDYPLQLIENAVDRFFDDDLFSLPMAWSASMLEQVAVDMTESPREFIIRASVPGIDPHDLEVTVEGKVLTIRGEVRMDDSIRRGNYFRRERRYGLISRQIVLPTAVNVDAIQASLNRGELTLRLPKITTSRPRRIRITSGAPGRKRSVVRRILDKLPRFRRTRPE